MKKSRTHGLSTAVLAWLVMAGLWGSVSPCWGTTAKGIYTPHGPVESGKFRLDYENDRLSLEANHAPVGDVLAEIGRVAHIEIGMDSRIDDTVTATFQGMPLEEAIKAIANNWGMVFAKKNGTDHVVQVVVPAGSPYAFSASTNEPVVPNAQTPSAKGPSVIVPSAKAQMQTSLGTPPASGATVSRYVPRELIVRFKHHKSRPQIKQILASKSATVKRHNPKGNYYVLSLPEQWPVPEAAAWFQSQGVVDFAEPNHLFTIQEIPDDMHYGEQWVFENMSAEAGWDLETGSSDVVIAVIDTGVAYTHPDLAVKMWNNPDEIPDNGQDDDGNGFVDDIRGWDFVSVSPRKVYPGEDPGPPDNDPMDFQGHGTHVAGIAGAVTNNQEGIAGVAWGCQIMAIRAGYKDTSGDGVLKADDAADAIRYAADNGAHVLNLSWGDHYDDTVIRESVSDASQKGLILCAAAGNENTNDPFYPAAYSDPLVLAVGATDRSDGKAGYSNYGYWVDVSAPGGTSSYGEKVLSTCLGNTYCGKYGTSMASPHVAGLAGLMLSCFPGWSSLTITEILLDSVRVVEALDGYNATSGIIDIYESLYIDAADLALFTQRLADHFGRANCASPDPCEGDLDGDGDVDGSDLACLAKD